VTRADVVVLKFGGAALSDADAVASRIRETRRDRVRAVVVASAREGVTDELRALLERGGARADRIRIQRISEGHPGLDSRGREELRRLKRAVARWRRRGRRRNPALADEVLAQGERLAVRWLVPELRARGLAAHAVDADRMGLVTDEEFGASTILLERSERAVRARLGRLLSRDLVPVVTGFLGRTSDGRVTTLGRGGSDYSATAIAAMLDARRVELVKRHVSVLTADPRAVPNARPIRRMSYEDAEEMAQFGAQVLHPLAVEPARARGIEVWVRSLDEPDRITAIGEAASNGNGRVRALSLLAPLRLVRVRVPGGRHRPGVVADVSEALRRAGVNLVTVFTSSALLSLVLEPRGARVGRRVLARFSAAGAASVDGPVAVALVTAIGEGVLDDLERWPASVLRGAQGFSATPRSLSLAVPEPRGRAALVALHRLLIEGRGA
jgi:aspartokinase/homoserine dehydrogenase 1